MTDKKNSSQSIHSVVSSVFSALLGVQSSEKYQEDTTHGKAMPFIIVGIIGTILFILTIIGLVNLMMYLFKT